MSEFFAGWLENWPFHVILILCGGAIGFLARGLGNAKRSLEEVLGKLNDNALANVRTGVRIGIALREEFPHVDPEELVARIADELQLQFTLQEKKHVSKVFWKPDDT